MDWLRKLHRKIILNYFLLITYHLFLTVYSYFSTGHSYLITSFFFGMYLKGKYQLYKITFMKNNVRIASISFISLFLSCSTLHAQNVGIGALIPLSKLHIDNGGLLVTGPQGATPVSGAGTRLMWVPEKAAFRAGIINGTQWDNTNIGLQSFAFGNNTIASGQFSSAFGSSSTALNTVSTAFGFSSIASGVYSTAMGSNTTASGSTSTAMGNFTSAKANDAFTLGSYNDLTDVPTGTAALTDRIFQIGNGDNLGRKNAMTVLRSGEVGVGTPVPLSKVHIDNGGFLITGATGSTPPVSGAGTRLMWIPQKSALRAGRVSGTEWDDINIGNESIAMGTNTKASGTNSTAIGLGSIASGIYSTAIGSGTASGYGSTAIDGTASGSWSTAMGLETIASGYGSTAIGFVTEAKAYSSFSVGSYNDNTDAPSGNDELLDRIFQIGNGSYGNRKNAMTVLRNGNIGIGSLVPAGKLHVENGALLVTGVVGTTPVSGGGTRLMWIPQKSAFRAGLVSGTQWDDTNIGAQSFAAGLNTIASGLSSTAMGYYTEALADYSTAMGYFTNASGTKSTAMGGFSSASGTMSTAMGSDTWAKAAHSLSVGSFNDISDNPDPIFPDPSDRIFQIGNGVNSRKNALTVLRNGTVGIRVLAPTAMLDVSRDPAFATTANFATAQFKGTSWYSHFNYSTTEDTYIRGGKAGSKVIINDLGGLGNVGIGTSNPTEKLDVSGNIKATGTITPSDRRFKQNINPLQNSLAKILSLNGVSYDWRTKEFPNKGFDETKQLGFIAQEVEKVFPEVVRTGSDGFKGVDYVKLIPALVEALKAQQKQIDELKEELKQVKIK